MRRLGVSGAGLLASVALLALAGVPQGSASAATGAGADAGADAGAYRDVLDTPARESALAARGLLNGVALAGRRLVAVGQRGHIVYSDDAGANWRQAKVPVSSDLVAVHFPVADQGWAVGHDGVILHSADGGANWTRQLDGRSAAVLLVDFYTELANRGALGDPDKAAALLDEIRRTASQAAETPFLDVWFADAQTGFVVGAFNQVFRTADGGKTWEPWFHRTDNPNRLHLYAIRGIAGDVYATGEQGLVLRLDAASGRFARLDTPYKGTFFGITGSRDALMAFGLRGTAYRSTDRGSTWARVETGVQEGLTGGAISPQGDFVLVSQSGNVLVSRDRGASFRRVADAAGGAGQPASAVVFIDPQALAIVGPRGARIQALR